MRQPELIEEDLAEALTTEHERDLIDRLDIRRKPSHLAASRFFHAMALLDTGFADQNGDWDAGVLAERMDHDWFDPDGFRMAWKADRLVAFCWTKVHPDSG